MAEVKAHYPFTFLFQICISDRRSDPYFCMLKGLDPDPEKSRENGLLYHVA